MFWDEMSYRYQLGLTGLLYHLKFVFKSPTIIVLLLISSFILVSICLTLEKTDAGRDWGQEEKVTTEDEMAGWHHRLDRHKFE